MSINKENNEFEGKIRISNFSSKKELLDKINGYCEKYRTEEKDALYDIEKETANLLLLNFHKNTELANYINRNLKLLQIGNSNFSDINFNSLSFPTLGKPTIVLFIDILLYIPIFLVGFIGYKYK